MRSIIIALFVLPLFVYAADPVVKPPAGPVAAAVAAVQAPAPTVHLSLPDQPPEWLAKVLDVGRSVPVVGPVLIEGLKWLGVFASVMTLLVTMLTGLGGILVPVFNLAGLAQAAAFILKLSNSPVMYWLKFFSLYNAKVQEEKKG